jgi:DNA-binding XRE family transcriptional regulator
MGQHDETGDDSGVASILPERPGDGEVIVLSEGERSLIYRRRMGLSQRAMAKSFGIDRRVYSEQETNDKISLPGFMVVVDPIEPHEQCLIWRRRSGWTQQACADLMGITRYWYNLMENGKAPSDKLEAFWNEG